MTSPPTPLDQQFVYLDPFLLDRARINAGYSRKKLGIESGVGVNTLLDYYRYFENAPNRRAGPQEQVSELPSTNGDTLTQPGKLRKGMPSAPATSTGLSRSTPTGRLRAETARKLASCLGFQVTDLLAPWDPYYVPPKVNESPTAGEAEWETVGYLDQGRLASNGVYYIVCRMQHRHTRGRLGRGKFYHLSWVPAANRETMLHRLSRHAEVSSRVGPHPHLALNLTSTPVGENHGWWVIDEWAGERTLTDYLQREAMPKEKLSRLLHEIALGLDALHQAGVIMRELAPSRVLLSDKDGRAVLTDFELAKLLDGSPSVSSDWPEDPFRAPEVESGQVTIQTDLFSLGQVALLAVGGQPGQASHALQKFGEAGVPKRLAVRLVDCLEALPSKRPKSLAPLLGDLARWKEKG